MKDEKLPAKIAIFSCMMVLFACIIFSGAVIWLIKEVPSIFDFLK